MAIFNSYVKLPEGKSSSNGSFSTALLVSGVDAGDRISVSHDGWQVSVLTSGFWPGSPKKSGDSH